MSLGPLPALLFGAIGRRRASATMQCSWTPTGTPAQWTCRGPAIEGPATARGPWKSFADDERESLAERDYGFADAAINRPGTMGQLLKESSQAVENLQFHMHGKPLVYVFWGLEVLWLVFLFVAASVELFNYCPFETGLIPHCNRCFSTTFLAWVGIHVFAWTLDIYVYILLVSRGFRFSPARPMKCLPDSNRSGIPRTPVLFFLALNVFLLLWGFAGFGVVIASNRCAMGGRIYQTVPRSAMMFYSTLFTVILSPCLFFLGRRASLPSETRQALTRRGLA